MKSGGLEWAITLLYAGPVFQIGNRKLKSRKGSYSLSADCPVVHTLHSALRFDTMMVVKRREVAESRRLRADAEHASRSPHNSNQDQGSRMSSWVPSSMEYVLRITSI